MFYDIILYCLILCDIIWYYMIFYCVALCDNICYDVILCDIMWNRPGPSTHGHTAHPVSIHIHTVCLGAGVPLFFQAFVLDATCRKCAMCVLQGSALWPRPPEFVGSGSTWCMFLQQGPEAQTQRIRRVWPRPPNLPKAQIRMLVQKDTPNGPKGYHIMQKAVWGRGGARNPSPRCSFL